MRLAALLVCLPGLSLADDFPVLAPVTEAEVFLSGALLTRVATVDLPAGSHRILIPHAPVSTPRLSVTGAALGQVEVYETSLVDGRAAFTDTQRAAYDALQAAQDAFHRAEDERLRAASGMKAAEDALEMLRSFSGAQIEALEAEAVGPFTAALTANITAAEIARADARAALRAAEQARNDATLVRYQARQAFELTGGQLDAVSQIAIGVALDAPGTVTVEIEAFDPEAGWSPSYDIDLGADGVVTFDRKAVVWQETGLPFEGVDLTLSTVDPNAQMAPRSVWPNRARMEAQDRSGPFASRSFGGETMAETDDLFVSPGVADDMVLVARPVETIAEGVVVTYAYPAPVHLPPGGVATTLSLDSVSTDAQLFNRASVRHDQTAFLMAGIRNTFGEPLLAGSAVYYREGTRLGEADLPFIPAGDEAELSFGPQPFLRVEFAALDNQTGDRGLFSTSGTRVQDLVFRIRNLSDDPAEVEARYALPYSEEEDLRIRLTADPAPDATDIDDAQGVSDWVLQIPAGGEQEVTIRVALEWPEGQRVTWSP